MVGVAVKTIAIVKIAKAGMRIRISLDIGTIRPPPHARNALGFELFPCDVRAPSGADVVLRWA